MRAWTVDADDIQIADDLDVTLLHRTSWIESFLEWKRSDQFSKEVLEQRRSFYRAEPIDPGVRAELRSADSAFNVKKPGSVEEDHFLRLFRIVEPRR